LNEHVIPRVFKDSHIALESVKRVVLESGELKVTELDFFLECFKKINAVVMEYKGKVPQRPSHYI